jgi:small subunit ribosomal protein S6
MTRYETLLLATPEVTGDEISLVEKHLDTIAKKAGGSVISYEKWGKYRLAYPVKHNDYGVYVLARFEIGDEKKQTAIEEIRTMCDIKYPHFVMRHMTTRLEPKVSLEYIKPESLEDAPAHDVDTFLRENKMDGLRGADRSSRYQADDEDMPADFAQSRKA